MKIKLLVLALLLTETVAQAQIEKGQGLVTGSISASFYRYTFSGSDFTSGSKQGNVFISYGTFIKKSILIGTELSLGGSTQTVRERSVRISLGNTSSIIVAPFARYFWQRDRLLLYTGGGIVIGRSQFSSGLDAALVHAKTTTFSASLQGQAGVIYQLSKRIGIELHATADVLPFVLSSAGAGLVLFTGASSQASQQNTSDGYSQLKRGGVVISAGFSTSQTKQSWQNGGPQVSDSSSRGTSANLAFGYFISNRTQVGISGSYTAGNNVMLGRASGYVQRIGASQHQFSIEPYIKRYLSESVLTPYVKGQLYWEIIKAGGPATDIYGGRLSAGMAYLLGRRFIIEAELVGLSSGYSKVNSTVITGPNHWNIQLDATLRPNFVLSYVLR